jgi:hypothetical protein
MYRHDPYIVHVIRLSLPGLYVTHAAQQVISFCLHKLVPTTRIELVSQRYQHFALPLSYAGICLVGPERIKLPLQRS